MVTIKLWSKCRLFFVLSKRVKIEIKLRKRWRALATLIIILSLLFPFGVSLWQILRNAVWFLINYSKILDQQNNIKKDQTALYKCIY